MPFMCNTTSGGFEDVRAVCASAIGTVATPAIGFMLDSAVDCLQKGGTMLTGTVGFNVAATVL